MSKIKITFSVLITLSLILFLNRSWNFTNTIPAFGRFLDPFHGFWQNAETGKHAPLKLTMSELKDEVTVIYDSVGIPHIFAKNDDDLYFAQGYVTARDRLWQMEFQTHAGAGRISEIIGKPGALDFDRGQRRMGMLYAAQNALIAMDGDPQSKSMIESYSNGVNAYISSLGYGDLPLEYKLLDYKPEPWTMLKVALLQINMAKTLNTGEKDMEMTNALRLFGPAVLDILYPDNENVGDPIVDRTGNWKFKPITLDSFPLAVPQQLVNIKSDEKPGSDVGSNNWAVSGTKTVTGSPMLCNDPHLNLTLPSIWYIIHLNAPGVNVMGASLPGAPTVVSGFNDSIAWGITNAQRDLVDWYQIKFKDKSRNEYLSDDKWKPTRKQVEKFAVRGSADFYDTVVYTHHGPIRYDEQFHSDKETSQFAYRWLSHDPATEFITFHLLNRARNHEEYMKALDHYHSPAQNFVFASAHGDIAMRIQGRYPVRRKNEGKFVLDGTKTSNEWKAYIPNEHNVMDKNPARGFVSSANQYPADSTYPYYINGSSFEAYRNRRINSILGSRGSLSVQDMMNLQFDSYNLKASESLPVLLGFLDSTRFSADEAIAFGKLKSWNFMNDIDSEGASYFEAWWQALVPMIWDEISSQKVSLEIPTSFTTIKLIKEKPDFSFFDILNTTEKESAGDVAKKSFSESVKNIAEWKTSHRSQSVPWAEYKDTFIGHLLQGLPAFSYHVRHGGNRGIVNASTHTHGPSWRMVVSLEKDGVKAWGVYPGGQSGNPGSTYYNNMLESWSQGKYFRLHFTSSNQGLAGASMSTVTFKPKSK